MRNLGNAVRRLTREEGVSGELANTIADEVMQKLNRKDM